VKRNTGKHRVVYTQAVQVVPLVTIEACSSTTVERAASIIAALENDAMTLACIRTAALVLLEPIS
jgi:hypothetical protein